MWTVSILNRVTSEAASHFIAELWQGSKRSICGYLVKHLFQTLSLSQYVAIECIRADFVNISKRLEVAKILFKKNLVLNWSSSLWVSLNQLVFCKDFVLVKLPTLHSNKAKSKFHTFYWCVTKRKFFIRGNKSKLDLVDTGHNFIAHLFPWSHLENWSTLRFLIKLYLHCFTCNMILLLS